MHSTRIHQFGSRKKDIALVQCDLLFLLFVRHHHIQLDQHFFPMFFYEYLYLPEFLHYPILMQFIRLRIEYFIL